MRWSAAVLVGCVMAGHAVSSVDAAEVYRWVDAKGVAHYSQLPPSSQQHRLYPCRAGADRTRRTARVAEKVTPASRPVPVGRRSQAKLSQPAAGQTLLSEASDRRTISEFAQCLRSEPCGRRRGSPARGLLSSRQRADAAKAHRPALRPALS